MRTPLSLYRDRRSGGRRSRHFAALVSEALHTYRHLHVVAAIGALAVLGVDRVVTIVGIVALAVVALAQRRS